MIWGHMILINLIKEAQLLHIQDSKEDQGVEAQEHFTSLRGQEVRLKVPILILVKYLRCSSLEGLAGRCRLTNSQTLLMKVAIPSLKCLVAKEVGLLASLEYFSLCKVEVRVHREEVGLGEILISDSHLLEAALELPLPQDFNSKSISQVINKNKISEIINLISSVFN